MQEDKPRRIKQAGALVAKAAGGLWRGTKYVTKGIGKGIAVAATAVWSVFVAILGGIWGVFAAVMVGLWNGTVWTFKGVRPLKSVAFLSILVVNAGLVYINTLGAWDRTHDVGYTSLVAGIEGVIFVALPIIFAARGWFNIPVAIAIFFSGLYIASINAKPALENILTDGRGVVNTAEMIAKAEKLEDEVYGLRDPETNARIEGSGLLDQVTRMETDASRVRTERGIVTAATKVDEDAAKLREDIGAKLALAEEYRGMSQDSAEASNLAIITYVVAELIRSFGLKALVGFGGGDGGNKKRKPKYRRQGFFRWVRHVTWRALFGDPGYEDWYDEEGRLKRSQAALDGHKTRTENETIIKLQHHFEAYVPQFRNAKANKLKRPKYLPHATADYYFEGMTEDRMDEVLTQMARLDLISEQDHDLLMDRVSVEDYLAARGANIEVIVSPQINGEGHTDVQSDDERDPA